MPDPHRRDASSDDTLRNALHHWARVASMIDPIAKWRYVAVRARGKPHGQALRSVADRRLAALCAMFRSQTAYRAVEFTAA